jgi:hypothetical protein
MGALQDQGQQIRRIGHGMDKVGPRHLRRAALGASAADDASHMRACSGGVARSVPVRLSKTTRHHTRMAPHAHHQPSTESLPLANKSQIVVSACKSVARKPTQTHFCRLGPT